MVVSLATLIYTLIGGIEAGVWTDVVQGFLFLAGGLVCILILMLGVYSHIVLFVVGYAASLFFRHEAPARSLTIHSRLDRRKAEVPG
ncbi:MAG: hypothetical protein HXY20_07745 [Acidobacteria bacterium]|nr:hypothetical protein [Acidobacteriota bacterium]